MAFNKLTRGEENAGFKKLEQRGVVEEDWLRMLRDDALARQVAERFIASRQPVRVELLKQVGTVAILATTGRFSAEFCFRVNKEANGLPRISFIWDDFRSWFVTKVEEPTKSSVLNYYQLGEQSRDDCILAALGGEAKAETTLTEIFQLMVGQKTGQAGPLLTNGWANIFYVKDKNGVLRVVGVSWREGGWGVGACLRGSPGPWSGGYRVFSRDSGSPLVA